jgi:phosphate-selective porin OprO and OprP
MILTTLLLMQGQALAPAGTGEEAHPDLPRILPFNTDDLKIFGRFQQDFAWIDDSNDTTVRDGSEARRARIGMAGNLAEGLDWKMEVDFASFDGGGAAFTDAYLKFSNLGFGVLKVGHFKEPFSLNELTSSRFITFTERADTFAPARNTGIMASDATDELTWQAGAFWVTDKYLDSGNDTAYTGRVVFRPYIEDGGRRLLHLGAALSIRENESGTLAGATNGGVHMGNNLTPAAAIAADGSTLIGLEAAWQEGPANAQLEYIQADGDNDSYSSWYVQGSYFLTGESRSYSTSSGAYGRVTPNTPWGQNGNGAWEVAARIQNTDFSDGGANQEMQALAIALNWYLTSHTRVMLDLYSADSDALADDVLAAVLRFGIDF